MGAPDQPDHERVEQRADERPPEEADSQDPEAQAAAVLADSDERQARADPVEHRSSEDTVAGQ